MVILAVEKALRPSKSTDFALELKQIHIVEDKDTTLMQAYVAFFEKFSYKVAEAEDAHRAIKPNVVKSTFKTAIAGHDMLKLWFEEVPWRGLAKAHARLLRKLREVKSWQQLQGKGSVPNPKRQRVDDGDEDSSKKPAPPRRAFRGTRAGRLNAVRLIKGSRRKVVRERKGRSNYGAKTDGANKRADSRASGEALRNHPGLDKRGENWHTDKDLFECFNTPCHSPFCQRCGRHGHTANSCRVPDTAPGVNLKGYYQEEKKGQAKLMRPPPKANYVNGDVGDEEEEHEETRGAHNNMRGSDRGAGRQCLRRV